MITGTGVQYLKYQFEIWHDSIIIFNLGLRGILMGLWKDSA